MIDWHSHILPNMDDGSKSVEESLGLLRLQLEQGAETVVATPHFYANDESPEKFLERRAAAFERLSAALPEERPEILLGAEVKYYEGISRMAELKALRIQSSEILLLEMPFSRWTEYMLRELVELSCMGGVRLTLAHIERYMRFQPRSTWERIYESGIMTQVNAGFFASATTRRRAIGLLKNGRIDFIGSDCHNLTSRPPRLDKAFKAIEKRFGGEFLSQMNDYGYSMLEKAVSNN